MSKFYKKLSMLLAGTLLAACMAFPVLAEEIEEPIPENMDNSITEESLEDTGIETYSTGFFQDELDLADQDNIKGGNITDNLNFYYTGGSDGVNIKNGILANTKGTAVHYGVSTKDKMNVTQPYVVRMGLKAPYKGQGAASTALVMRSSKQNNLSVNIGTNLPSHAVYFWVTGDKMGLGYTFRDTNTVANGQNVAVNMPISFADLQDVVIYDDTINNTIYYYVQQIDGNMLLLAKVQLSYPTGSSTKLVYTFYGANETKVEERTVNAKIPQTGSFYSGYWTHFDSSELDYFYYEDTPYDVANLTPDSIDFEGLNGGFDKDTLEYTIDVNPENPTISFNALSNANVALKVSTDDQPNLNLQSDYANLNADFTIPVSGEINLANSNFLYVNSESTSLDGQKFNQQYLFTLRNIPNLISTEELKFNVYINSGSSIDFNSYFTDNIDEPIQFEIIDKTKGSTTWETLDSGIWTPKQDEFFNGNVELKAKNSIGERIVNVAVSIFAEPTNSNATSIKVGEMITEEGSTEPILKDYISGECDLTGANPIEVILPSDLTEFVVDVVVPYLGSYTIKDNLGNTYKSLEYIPVNREITSLSIVTKYTNFNDTTYSIQIKKSPYVDEAKIVDLRTDYKGSYMKAYETYEVLLDELIYSKIGLEMTEYTVTDETGKNFGTVEKKTVGEGENQKTGFFWTFMVEEVTASKTFTITGITSDGISATANFKAEFVIPSELALPAFGSGFSVTDIAKTSAVVNLPEVTKGDFDVKCLNLYYWKFGGEKTKISGISLDEDAYELTGLKKGSQYYVEIEAEEVTGRVSAKRLKEEFTTKGESSSGGSGGGGGGGNTVIGGGGFTVEQKPTEIPTVDPDEKPPVTIFTDMGGYSWAENAVKRLYEKGVVKGVTETTFAPQENVTRADFLVMLMRALKLNVPFDSNFSDIAPTDYYYEAVGMAKAIGIAKGDGENFNPTAKITRQDMIVLTYNTLKHLEKIDLDKTGESFQDIMDVSDYALEAVGVLNGNGLVTGDQNGNINPLANTTRAEAAVLIDRILGE